MRELKTEGMEIVAARMTANARAKERARKRREQQVERLISILYRMIIAAAVLMVLAGAGVIDSAPTLPQEGSGWLLMLGGIAVMAVTMALFRDED